MTKRGADSGVLESFTFLDPQGSKATKILVMFRIETVRRGNRICGMKRDKVDRD